MLKRLMSFLFLGAVSVAVLSAQTTKTTIPLKQTPVNDGKVMFDSYCASCHGLDGRGDGPTAAALKIQPADLTQLSKNNKGTYPETHVLAVLKFGSENPAHGSKAMPVWGPALRKMDHSSGNDRQTLRLANLVKYVETLQAK